MATNSTKMILFKACPRCYGDLVLDADSEPRMAVEPALDYVCIQCGRRKSIVMAVSMSEPAVMRTAA